MNEATRKGLEAILAEATEKVRLLTAAAKQYDNHENRDAILRAIEYRSADYMRRGQAARELLLPHIVNFGLEIDGETHTF